MKIPKFKVTVTHGGSDTDYENEAFSYISVKRPINNFSTAILLADNKNSRLYTSAVTKFDVLKIYVKDYDDANYTQIFGGTVREANPTKTNDGAILRVNCKGFGAALAETHCSRDYGKESSNSSLDTAKEIWDDLVDNFINKSLGTADNTGYAITKTYIADIASGTTISFVNNPYTASRDAINKICQIVTAIQAGSAGPHWFVDPSKNLFINTIGNHENAGQWPNYWNTDQAGSTLTEGIDFNSYQVFDKTEEFANKIVFITDFRRPGYDYWTEDTGGASLWGNDALKTLTDSNTQFVVGSHSLRLETNAAIQGYAYYPSGAAANWDVATWGSEKTVPHVSFYFYKDTNIAEANTWIYMSTNDTARKTDFFYCAFNTWTEPDDTWLHKSIPIGPFWASAEESKQFRWTANNSPSWNNIDTIEFTTGLAGGDGLIYIDDLHFSGKIIREAKNSTSIASNDEYQKVVISRTAMDDSGIASDDTGTAARYAYAELLRRQTLPITIQFTVPLKHNMLPGQKAHICACKTASGSFNIDADYRIVLVHHEISTQPSLGCATTVTATSDLLNSFPLTGIDQYELLTEYLLVNNREAKDMRAGAEVDLLINVLSKDYP